MFIDYRKKFFIVLLVLGMIFIPSSLVFGQSSNSAQIGIFTPISVIPDARVEVPIEIRDIEGLYALDITLQFDPSIVIADDADPASPGIQMALGQFLDPGLMLYNTVDNTKGTAHFVMTQFNPSEPKSGDGILLVIYLKGIKSGESSLTLTNVQLSNRDGMQISATTVNSLIKVDASAPAVTTTSIPVQEATKLVQIPTMMPTPTPTLAPTPTPVSITMNVEQKGTTGSAELPQTGGENQKIAESTIEYFMLNNWWIVVVLLLLVIAAGVYLVASQKSHH